MTQFGWIVAALCITIAFIAIWVGIKGKRSDTEPMEDMDPDTEPATPQIMQPAMHEFQQHAHHHE